MHLCALNKETYFSIHLDIDLINFIVLSRSYFLGSFLSLRRGLFYLYPDRSLNWYYTFIWLSRWAIWKVQETLFLLILNIKTTFWKKRKKVSWFLLQLGNIAKIRLILAPFGSVWLFEQFEQFQAFFFFVLSTS